jgi:hypothetical protein
LNDVIRGPNGRWLPGNPGGGRPPGSRQKIAEQIIRDIAEDWNAVDRDGQRNGPKALARLREDDPSRYVAAALGLVPKDWLIQIQSQPSRLQVALESVTPEEMAMIAEGFQLISKIGAPALETLRALAAKQVPSDILTDGKGS